MNGRFFSGQPVEAYISEGNEKFKKTSEKKGIPGLEADADADGDEGKRLDEFGSWLEGEPKTLEKVEGTGQGSE